MEGGRSVARRRFLLDSDGSDVFHNLAAEPADLEAVVAETVAECPPDVTTYLLCSIAGTCYFPIRVGLMDPPATTLTLYNPLVYPVADVLDTYVYRLGLVSSNYSMSAAIGLARNIVGFFLLLLANYVMRRLGESGVW